MKRAVLTLLVALVPGMALAGPFDGTYVLAQQPTDVAAFEAAIEKLVAPVPGFVRERATKKVRATMQPAKRIELASKAGTLQISNDKGSMTLTTDWVPQEVRAPDGKTATLRCRIEGGVIHLESSKDGGRSTTTFRLDGDTAVLHVRRVVHPKNRDEPVTFSMTYERRVEEKS